MNEKLKNEIVRSLLGNGIRKMMQLQSTKRRELEAAIQAGTTIENAHQIADSFEKQIVDVETLYQSAAGKIEEGITDDMVDEMVNQSLEADRDIAIATLKEWSGVVTQIKVQ